MGVTKCGWHTLHIKHFIFLNFYPTLRASLVVISEWQFLGHACKISRDHVLWPGGQKETEISSSISDELGDLQSQVDVRHYDYRPITDRLGEKLC